ncbi:PREDICTED: uncharacterized protein LOC106116202 [Papilio xuthus]|uniref:Uncharacterized protein LOC106116202 n=1 Tax=Papilio xuthus TaxID=66420 RepID=A0AAJ6Z4U0_PAPXU|nr:PREDICTED: uncharacterized protein LOC106116202 [Papilio xuthus]
MRNPDYNVLETPTHGRYVEQKVEYNPVNVFTNNRFINKPKFPSYTVDRDDDRQSSNYKTMKIQEVDINDSNVFKLTRDQIISQLIKNRVELYIRIKEAKGIKSNLDINYNLAKRIRTQLESGNYSLAKELFSVFITNTVTDTNEFSPKNIFKGLSSQHVNVDKDAIFPLPQVNMKNTRNDVKFVASEGLLKQLNALKEISF